MSHSISSQVTFQNLCKIDAKSGDFPDHCIVEGVRACSVFVDSIYYKLKQWFVSPKLYDSLPSFVDPACVIKISEQQMQMVSRATTPSGLLGLFVRRKPCLEECKKSTFVLYNIADPGNLGTIIRTAVALNRSAIILIGGCHYHNSKVVQSTAGMIAKIEVLRISWEDFLQQRDKTIPLFALDARGTSISKFNKEYLRECYWVVGNEARGLPTEIKPQIDHMISIPMGKSCESLNAAIAASLVGYRSWSAL